MDGLSQTHTYKPGTYAVSVTLNATGCPSVSFPMMVTVTPCKTPPTPTKTQIDLCTGLLWAAIILSIIGMILVIVGCVVAHFYPYAGWVIEAIGWVIFGIAALCFLFWWIFCRFITPCAVILAVRTFVIAVLVVSGIGGAVGLVLSAILHWLWPCIARSIAGFAYWAVVNFALNWLAENRHCLIENPSGTPPPAASSSSALTGRDPTHDRVDRSDASNVTSLGASPRAQALPVQQPAMAMTAEQSRPAGLGDVVKTVTSAIGIKPCEGCHKRAEQLNRAFPLGASGKGESPPAAVDPRSG